MADLGGVGVGGVEEELDSGGLSAGKIAGVVVGDDYAGVGVTPADGVAKLVDGGVVAGQFEALAFGEGRDQLAALGRAAVIDHCETHVGHVGAEREAEQRELQDRWQDERNLKTAVAADLVELLADEGAEAMAEQAIEEVGEGHAFTCIFLMPRQARV